jgi:hypothetical protein
MLSRILSLRSMLVSRTPCTDDRIELGDTYRIGRSSRGSQGLLRLESNDGRDGSGGVSNAKSRRTAF